MGKLAWIVHGLFGIVLVAGIIGMAVYGSYLEARGPFLLVNNYIALWLTSLLTFFTLQSFYTLIAPHPHYEQFAFALIQFIYHFLTGSLCLIICVGYALYGRVELAIWSAVATIICWINIYLVIYVRRDKLLDYTKKNIIAMIVSVFNWLLRFCFLVMACFLAAGALYHGTGAVAYPPRGTLHTVTLPDGRSQSVHVYCEGPVNASIPVVLWEGSAAHGYADYLGLQRVVSEQHFRSCSWDKVGLGWSDYMLVDQHGPEGYYHSLIESVKQTERAPFIFVGWGAGGAFVYDYAAHHPENVAAIIYVDAYPIHADWLALKDLINMTDAQVNATMANDVQDGIRGARMHNVIGVPWGLMSALLPADHSYPEELRSEKRWFYLTEKMRITQRWVFEDLPNQRDVFAQNITGNITVSAVMSAWNASQVGRLVCDTLKLDNDACDLQKKNNDWMIDAKKGLVKNGGMIVECREDVCDQGYFVDVSPHYTVNQIVRIWEYVRPRVS
ncbi:uncharacterized protein LOC129586012 [Paramacrobiotus metropolitanus]|uniref:uncharacterized protein LOC129586012 n=1 Tax=Paramacrobiotus metropolitanus TaxID=2943436 RepID=UPI002445F75A|nr:uncharacterized protein LOC129586012 [Paramacrobiotus metropolitanus]